MRRQAREFLSLSQEIGSEVREMSIAATLNPELVCLPTAEFPQPPTCWCYYYCEGFKTRFSNSFIQMTDIEMWSLHGSEEGILIVDIHKSDALQIVLEDFKFLLVLMFSVPICARTQFYLSGNGLFLHSYLFYECQFSHLCSSYLLGLICKVKEYYSRTRSLIR